MTKFSSLLNELIPGGAHTYSRGDDQFPENAPSILVSGEGCWVVDPQGRKYLDYGMALRAVTVGYGHRDIARAAFDEILKGNNLTRPSVTELKAAEAMIGLIHGADMVKFGKNGSTVTTAAVKLARAFTGRNHIAICAQHPFFSYDDWFIGTTPMSKGTPKELRSLTLKFDYNDLGSVEKLFEVYPGRIAALIMEPATAEPPLDAFLEKAMALAHRNGALFILDEMITGFRWHLHGAQAYYGITPDLSTFGKGMANGFSLAALVGRREIMSLGGIAENGAERVFLISTTHGAEMCSLGAFLKTVEIYQEQNVVAHLWDYGEKLMRSVNDIAAGLGIEKYFSITGFPCSPNYVTRDARGDVSLEFRTLFSQEMIRAGVLMPWIALSLSHGDRELDLTLEAIRKALTVYSQALDLGVKNYLTSRVIKPVFRARN